ncbi:GlcG protein [Streptomyces nodosus]|uniref:GlcG protein n=2 Tax=Streptomyces nodosus TaxID=40318 RepID=A0A0B5DL44_9ACTN|nr:GlcG protein [Streptomyces nodosus]
MKVDPTMLSFDIAQRIAHTVLEEGRRRGTAPLTVAVLDAGGHQVVLYRQDGAGIVRPQIAVGKAWGSLGLGFSSRGIAEAAKRFPGFFDALAVASDGRMFPAPGGVLLRDGSGVIVGAVGVSGDSSDVDEACAVIAAREAGLVPEPAVPTASA